MRNISSTSIFLLRNASTTIRVPWHNVGEFDTEAGALEFAKERPIYAERSVRLLQPDAGREQTSFICSASSTRHESRKQQPSRLDPDSDRWPRAAPRARVLGVGSSATPRGVCD